MPLGGGCEGWEMEKQDEEHEDGILADKEVKGYHG